ncbi:MAG: hypothetical protein II314_05375 [Prevotella sp.]|nr:hypothetical protein [Prevotella sp.]
MLRMPGGCFLTDKKQPLAFAVRNRAPAVADIRAGAWRKAVVCDFAMAEA